MNTDVPDDVAHHLKRLNTNEPHPARRYNYWLGGKDNFAADRESGDKLAELYPTVRLLVLENRACLRRIVRFLVSQGVRQFLDIGTGIPAPGHPHEVAQELDPSCRVVYVDNDPVVLAHSRALLRSTGQGATAYVDADAHRPQAILDDPTTRATLDFDQPIGLLLFALLHFLDDEAATRCVSTLTGALPAGSYLALTHGTADFMSEQQREAVQREIASGKHGSGIMRSREELTTQFFDGMTLVEPGVVPITEWRPADPPEQRPTPAEAAFYAGVARIG